MADRVWHRQSRSIETGHSGGGRTFFPGHFRSRSCVALTEAARVNDDFKILFEFFERHRREVGGRELEAIPPELREKLARFAEGRCSDEERAEMKQLLFENPQLIPLLVTETVALRQAQR